MCASGPRGRAARNILVCSSVLLRGSFSLFFSLCGFLFLFFFLFFFWTLCDERRSANWARCGSNVGRRNVPRVAVGLRTQSALQNLALRLGRPRHGPLHVALGSRRVVVRARAAAHSHFLDLVAMPTPTRSLCRHSSAPPPEFRLSLLTHLFLTLASAASFATQLWKCHCGNSLSTEPDKQIAACVCRLL